MIADHEGYERRQRELFEAQFEPIQHLLADQLIKDVMLNSAPQPDECGRVFVDIEGVGIRATDVVIDPAKAMWMIRAVAAKSCSGKPLDEHNPVMSCRAALGQFRFEALIPPAVVTPSFVIRKYIRKAVSLSDYVADGVVTPPQMTAIADAVVNGVSRFGAMETASVLVCGETSSGKTTMLSALLALIGRKRLLIIEDQPEIECPAGPSTKIETSAGLSFQQAIASALRQRPDGIVVGEIRHPEVATQALRAWKTGHQGFGTLHAPSCRGALWELFDLTRQSETGRNASPRQVASAVGVVIHLSRSSGRRKADVQLVDGWDGSVSDFRLKPLV